MKIFLISPVRGITDGELGRVNRYEKKLRQQGHSVHLPIRDTNQDDPIGLRICQDNRRAIKESDEIHIWWSEKSQGSLFDFGMAFMAQLFLPKIRIVLANPKDTMPTPIKSFNNVLLTLHGIDLKPYLLMLAVKKDEGKIR
ncbi:MAG: hypothetical protein HYW70_03305 [Candidatus Nealsonbacteria bacterium]|nr:hypothetical protein [Candidatus Nealsonbacteria bacterium]